MDILYKIISFVFLILMPPLLFGFINKTKAVIAGRTGASLLQPYYSIIKLCRKGTVISTAASWIFTAGPAVCAAAVLCAGILIPFGSGPAVLSFKGDVFLFAYLLALSRFFTTAAAMDTGSSFEGMGAAREVSFACMSEPALFFGLIVLTKNSSSICMETMLHKSCLLFQPALAAPFIFVCIGLFLILLAETCRIPVDDPKTHLELTMIHEVMVLDHSGPLLGLIEYSSAQKYMVLGTIILHLAVPFSTGNIWTDMAFFAVKLICLAVFTGIVESVMARLRMNRVMFLLTGALLLCGSGFILLLR